MTGSPERDRRVGFTRRNAVQRGAFAASIAAGYGLIEAVAAKAQTDAVGATPTAATVPDDFRVVLHAAEVQHWPYVLSNLRNLTAEWPRARLRVVVDGSAVTALQGENNLTGDLGELSEAGVELLICPNALREHGIDVSAVPAFAETSFGGIVALVLANRDGFVYVKP